VQFRPPEALISQGRYRLAAPRLVAARQGAGYAQRLRARLRPVLALRGQSRSALSSSTTFKPTPTAWEGKAPATRSRGAEVLCSQPSLDSSERRDYLAQNGATRSPCGYASIA
jgi:hypothetical protein